MQEHENTLIPHLVVHNAADAIEFYKKALDFVQEIRIPTPDGRILHCKLTRGPAVIMLCDEFSDMDASSRSPQSLHGSAVTLHLAVPDIDAAFAKAITAGAKSPSRLIDARIKELGDWRGKTLSHVRALIKQADPEVVEEWKWRGVPVWSHDGMICTGETYKSVVKLTFAKGASLKDPSGLFNSSLEGNTRRAIDLHEGDEIDEDAFKTLIRAAAALNRPSAR
jgi:hypothetical protein